MWRVFYKDIGVSQAPLKGGFYSSAIAAFRWAVEPGPGRQSGSSLHLSSFSFWVPAYIFVVCWFWFGFCFLIFVFVCLWTVLLHCLYTAGDITNCFQILHFYSGDTPRQKLESLRHSQIPGIKLRYWSVKGQPTLKSVSMARVIGHHEKIFHPESNLVTL